MTILLFILTNGIAKIMQSIAYHVQIQGAYLEYSKRVQMSREKCVYEPNDVFQSKQTSNCS